MANNIFLQRRSGTGRAGFTLIELLCVIAIIALLASLVFPVFGKIRDNADTTQCLSNLRQVGVSLNLYAAEHSNTFPIIETDPTNPVYTPDQDAKPIGVVLAPYGVTDAVLTCPADLRAKLNYSPEQKEGTSFFAQKKTSYEWRPMFDGEVVTAPKIYTPRGAFPVPPSRIRLLVDFVNAGEAPHERNTESSSYNNLHADGTVRTLVATKVETKK